MPNGREKDEDKQIESTKSDGWEFLGQRPEWVVSAAKNKGLHKEVGFGIYDIFHGDTFVYRVEPTVHGVGVRVYRKLKSDYFDTTKDKGTCPNCQSYVRRYDDDRFLTCHRCGWTVGYPILRWLLYPSWVDYYLGD